MSLSQLSKLVVKYLAVNSCPIAYMIHCNHITQPDNLTNLTIHTLPREIQYIIVHNGTHH